MRNRGFEVAKGFEDKGINLPERKTKYSAGYDIEAAEDHYSKICTWNETNISKNRIKSIHDG